jgi:hypothetical protein
MGLGRVRIDRSIGSSRAGATHSSWVTIWTVRPRVGRVLKMTWHVRVPAVRFWVYLWAIVGGKVKRDGTLSSLHPEGVISTLLSMTWIR